MSVENFQMQFLDAMFGWLFISLDFTCFDLRERRYSHPCSKLTHLKAETEEQREQLPAIK